MPQGLLPRERRGPTLRCVRGVELELRKLVVAIVTCALALAAIFALWLANLDIARYRGLIEEQAGSVLGRQVTIAGDLSLGLSLRPTLVASEVTIANPPWASRDHLARFERVEATAALLPLLAQRVEIDRLRIDGADIRLERSADGEANWSLGRQQRLRTPAALSFPRLAGAAHAADAVAALAPADAYIAEIAIRNADLVYRDGTTGQEHRLRLATSDLASRDADSPAEVSASGELDGAAVDLRGRVGPLADLLAETAGYPIDLDLRWLGLDARVQGTLDIDRETGLDLAIRAAADDVRPVLERLAVFAPQLTFTGADGPLHLAGRIHGTLREPGIEDLMLTTRLFGVDVRIAGGIGDLNSFSDIELAVEAQGDPVGLRALAPGVPIGSLSIKGQAVGGASALMLRELAMRLGRTDFAGELTVLQHRDRPKVIGRMRSDRLSLPIAAARWPADPALAAVLHMVDVDLRVETDRLVLGPVEAREVSLDVALTGGVLQLDRLKADLAGSKVEGTASLDAPTGELALRLDLVPFDANGLLTGLGLRGLLAGEGSVHLDLRAQDAGPDVWLRTLTGRVEAQLADGAIGSSPMLSLLGEASASAQAVGFDCLDLDLSITDGVARPEVMQIDSEAATVKATGAIDLAGGAYDLAVVTTVKTADLPPIAPIRITGPLGAPRIELAEPGAVGGMAALLDGLASSSATASAPTGPWGRNGCGRPAAGSGSSPAP